MSTYLYYIYTKHFSSKILQSLTFSSLTGRESRPSLLPAAHNSLRITLLFVTSLATLNFLP